MSDYRTFVIPFDFSEHARAALLAGTDLAKRMNADIHLVHVIQPPTYAYGYGGDIGGATTVAFNMTEVRNSADASLSAVAEGVQNFPGKIEAHVLEGSQVDAELRGIAEKLDADLIVMGTHGRTGLAHVFLGSVAERTLRIAPCPVLTVKAPEGSESDR